MNAFSMMNEQEIENMRKAAAAAKARPAAFLKFDSGVWTIAGADVTDSTWLALPDQAMCGWKRFQGKQVIEECMVPITKGLPPRPDTYTDKEQWEKGNGGRAMDPWSRQWILPLFNEHSGKIAQYTAASVAGRIAIADVIDDFIAHRRRQIVVLTSELVRIDGQDVHEPRFAIVNRSESDTEIAVSVPEKIAAVPPTKAAKPATTYNSMNDDIPF